MPWVHSASLKGVEKINIETGLGEVQLTLFFCKQDDEKSQFSVFVNDQPLLVDFSPKLGEDSTKKMSFKVHDKLSISFKKKQGDTLISELYYKIN